MKYLPNFLSLGVLGCGFAGLASVLAGDGAQTLRFILAAGLLDGLAGAAAYRLDQRSEFGEELDLMASLCSLGILPLAYAYETSLASMGRLGLYMACLTAVFMAVRLSRGRGADPKHQEHRGLPVPVTGLLIGLAIFLGAPPRAMVLVLFALIFLMLLPWGYLRTPASGLVQALLALLILASAWLETPALLGTLALSLAFYSVAGHLPRLKQWKFLRHY